MRCYFLHDGQVAGVEMLPPGLSDKGAIATGRLLSSQREEPLDGFEVWHRNRMVFRLHAPPPPRRLCDKPLDPAPVGR